MDINFENFSKFKILVGTIISIEINKKAKKPAFELDVDFGKEIGIKKTSAQITNYDLEKLINSQIIAVTNFPAKNIAGVISEVLVLGALNTNGVQLLRVDQHVPNGTIIS